MTSHALTGANRLVWQLRDKYNEDMQFAVHAGAKEVASYSAVYTAMDAVFNSMAAAEILGNCTLTGLVIQAWASSPGFEGFHQVDAVSRSGLIEADVDLPPQIAIVVGWRNTDSEGFGLVRQSRRNRTYVGPLRVDVQTSDGGKVSTEAAQNLSDIFEDLHDALGGVTGATGWSGVPRLAVTSPKNDLAMNANEVLVGHAFDTMRSRRQKVVEAPVITAL